MSPKTRLQHALEKKAEGKDENQPARKRAKTKSSQTEVVATSSIMPHTPQRIQSKGGSSRIKFSTPLATQITESSSKEISPELTWDSPNLDQVYYLDDEIKSECFADAKLWQKYARNAYLVWQRDKTEEDKITVQYLNASLTMAALHIFRYDLASRWPPETLESNTLREASDSFTEHLRGRLAPTPHDLLSLDWRYVFPILITENKRQEVIKVFERAFRTISQTTQNIALSTTPPKVTADNWRELDIQFPPREKYLSTSLVCNALEAIEDARSAVELDFCGTVLEPLFGKPLRTAGIAEIFVQQQYSIQVNQNWAPKPDLCSGIVRSSEKIPIFIVEVEGPRDPMQSAHKDTRKLAQLLRHSLEIMARTISDIHVEKLRVYGVLLSTNGYFEFVEMHPVRERRNDIVKFNFCLQEKLLEGRLQIERVERINFELILKISSFLRGPVRDAMLSYLELIEETGHISEDRFPGPQPGLKSRPSSTKFTPEKKPSRKGIKRDKEGNDDNGEEEYHGDIQKVGFSMLRHAMKCGYEFITLLGDNGRSRAFHLRRGDNDYVLVVKFGDGREIQYLQGLQDVTNVVRLFKFFQLGNCYGMILEKLERNEDHNVMERYVKDLFSALHALHSRGIVHHDIKPDNFGYSPMRNRWALFDFNLAEKIGDATTISNAGTDTFIAPEVDRGEPHGYPADIYSAGRTLQYMYLLSSLGPLGPRLIHSSPSKRPTALDVLKYLEQKIPLDIPTPESQPPSN
ncbi:uncharacterized protein VTP21DRAFT_9372 [Calcarisporiella thermophila]|uniref:uncharacterized protein n=1 Tax=Calcarisporiella thermophila TaxID=911321 RepID=UPI003743B2D5